MDIKRLKLVSDFFKKLGNHTQSITSAEMINDNLVQLQISKPNFQFNQVQKNSQLYDLNTMNKLNQYQVQNQQNFKSFSPQKDFFTQIIETKGDKTKQVIQVIKNEDQIFSQLQVEEYHEKILNNDIQGPPFSWNKKQTKFLYIANPKPEQGKYILDMELEKQEDLEEFMKFKQYVQDYGEGMEGIINPKLYEYDIINNTLQEIILPSNILVCNPQYLDEEGNQIVIQGFKEHPEFKYGILHCFNRECDIYVIEASQKKQLYPKVKNEDKTEEKEQKIEPIYKKISEDVVSVFPKVSPDFSKILYFNGPIKGSHLHYMGIKIINTKDFTTQQILDFSYEYKKNQFMGVAGFFDDLTSATWLKDSNHFIFNCIQENQTLLYCANIKQKSILNLSKGKCKTDGFKLLSYDQQKNIIFALHQNNNQPKQLNVMQVEQDDSKMEDYFQQQNNTNLWKTIDVYSKTQDNSIKIISDFLQENVEEEILYYNDVQCPFWRIKDYNKLTVPEDIQNLFKNNDKLNPLLQKDSERPLLVLAHGGPHAAQEGRFSLLRLYFLIQGYGIIAPNFSGSAGFGQDFIERLATHTTDMDIKEIIQFKNQVVERKLCDPKKVIVTGGSYGGQICGTIAGQYHEDFKCVVQLNAVLNNAFNINITDIPDWVSYTIFNSNKMIWNHTPEDYKKMLEASPMLTPAKIPVLNLIGAKDRRVPYQQGMRYHHQAKSVGTLIETFIYPESNHGLCDSLQTDFDVLLKMITFIERQLLE